MNNPFIDTLPIISDVFFKVDIYYFQAENKLRAITNFTMPVEWYDNISQCLVLEANIYLNSIPLGGITFYNHSLSLLSFEATLASPLAQNDIVSANLSNNSCFSNSSNYIYNIFPPVLTTVFRNSIIIDVNLSLYAWRPSRKMEITTNLSGLSVTDIDIFNTTSIDL